MRLNQDLIQRMFDGRGGASGGGSSLDPGLIAGLATEMWTEENYVSKTFFNELFVIHKKTTTTVYDGDTVVSTTTDTSGTFAPNEIPSQEESTDEETGYRTVVVTEVDNIEAKKGLWTDFFLSALGLNGSGGGGGIGDVTWQALGDNTDTRQIASSHLTTALSSALAGYATQSWVTSQNYVTSSAISDMATKTWVNNQSFVNWTELGDTTTTQQIALSHLTTALSGYATQTWVTTNFSTPATVATQMQTYAKIQNGTITIGDTSLTPITSVSGTFWGKSFTNGGTVNGTIKAGSNGGAIEQFHSVEMNSAGTLAGYGGFIDFHYYASGSTFDSTLDYTSRIIESAVGVISILAKNNNATNANKLAGLLVGAGFDGSYVQIGDLRIVYDSTNNALKVVKLVSGSEVAANFYATGSVSALGYGADGGGGTGDVTWTNLADNSDTRQIALSHLTGALAGYATTSQLAGYLPLTAGSTKPLTGGLYMSYNRNTQVLYTFTATISDILADDLVVMQLGQSLTTGNMGQIIFHYAGNNSDNNTLHLGFLSNYKILNVLNSGRVGINNTTPTEALDVNGDVKATNFKGELIGNASTATTLKTSRTIWGQNFNGSGNVDGTISVTNHNAAYTNFFNAYDNSLQDDAYTTIIFGKSASLNCSAQLLYQHVGDSSTSNRFLLGFFQNYEILVLTNSGNVGIGTTSPSYKLHVDGNAFASSFIKNGGTSSQFLKADGSVDSTTYATTSQLAGYLPLTGGQMTGAITWGTNYGNTPNGWVNYNQNGGIYILNSSRNDSGAPYLYSSALHVSGIYWFQLAIVRETEVLSFRGGNSAGVTTGGWKTVAFTDSNVASATKLQTARSLWGNSFDGTANVTGNINLTTGNQFNYIGNLAGLVGFAINYTSYNNEGQDLRLFNGAGSEKVTIKTNGYVGIGTNSPSYNLHVNGTLYASGNSSIDGTLSVAGSSSFTNSVTASSFIKTNGTSSQFLKADGSVDSNAYATTSQLAGYLPLTGGQMTGAITWGRYFGDDANGWNIYDMSYGLAILSSTISSTAAPYSYSVALLVSGVYWYELCYGRDETLYWRGGNTVGSQTGTGWRTVIDSSNIGSYNAGSSTKLQTARSLWGNSFDGTADVTGSISLTTGNQINYTGNKTGLVGFAINYTSYNNAGQDLRFFNGAQVERVTIKTNGYVGIGTNSPSYNLHVAGTFYANNTATFGSNVVSGTSGGAIEGFQSWELNTHNTAGTNIGGFLDFHYNGTAQDYSVRLIEKDYSGVLQILAKDTGTGNAQRAGLIVGAGTYTSFIQIGNGRIVWNDSDHALRIVDKDGNACNLYATGGISALGYQSGGGGGGSTGVFSTSITPDTTGTYDIGTSTYKWRNLYLCGASDGSKGFSIITNYSDYTYIGSVRKVRFGCNVDFDDWIHVENRIEIGGDNSNYDLYVSGENGGDAYFLGNVSVASLTNRSDMRLKDVVGDVNLSVQQIASAPAFKFRFKEKAKRTMVGTSAQYWDAVLPESVTRDADGILGLDYGVTALVSTIILAKGMTEHERRITKLEMENAELRARIKDLEEN